MASEVQDMEDALGRVVRDTARPISLGFGLFLGYTAIRGIIALSGRERLIVAGADVGVAAYLLFLAAWLYLRPPPMSWMNGLGATIAIALAGTDMATMATRGAVPSFPATTLVYAGFGAVVLSWRWLLSTLGGLWVAWLAVTQLFTANPMDALFTLQIATIAGIAIHGGRLRAYRQLIQARNAEAATRQELEEVNEELDRFAAVVAHDLKNPIAAIRLKAAALRYRTDPGDVENHHTLAEMDHVAASMSRMVDDVLSYARAGRDLENRETVDLEGVMARVEEVYAEVLRETEGRIDVRRLPRIDGDPTMLMQLMQNLVGNALAYRRQGVPPRITIFAEVRMDGITLVVGDNGQGFDPAEAHRLFEPFERGDTSERGHGLGLATCHRIVEAHGGTIHADSEPGHGSTFTVRLPGKVSPPRLMQGGEKGEEERAALSSPSP